jgi:hypothetical protein
MFSLRQELDGQCRATGVGSLPHKEASSAVDLVLSALGRHVVFWPQLPRRDFSENMYVQYGEGFPGLQVDAASRSVWVDTEDPRYLPEFEACFGNIQEAALDRFAIGESVAAGLGELTGRLMETSYAGWVKAQVIGPLSWGLTLLDQNKQPILYNADLKAILAPFLALKAAGLVRQVRVTNRTRVVIFIDEPYLVAVGTNACGLKREEIIALIDQVAAAIHEAGALAGLHICGNTDWEMVFETQVDLVNFDAFAYFDKVALYANAFKRFRDRGGRAALGIVPNDAGVDEGDLENILWKRLSAYPVFWEKGAFITTRCGCAALSEAQAATALLLSAAVAERVGREIGLKV